MNFLLKQRRLIATLATLACLIYTSHVTIQIFMGLSNRNQCYHTVSQGSMRHVLARSFDQERKDGSLEDEKRTQKLLSGSSVEHIKLPYRLDMVKTDIEEVSKGIPPDEHINEVEDKTDYFSCADFDRIPRTRKEVEENLRGNRGISFVKVRIDGITIPAVMKEANRRYVHKGHILNWQAYKNASFDETDLMQNNIPLYRTVVEEYKYNSARREIQYLIKLRGLRGTPRLLGSCVEELRIRYLVERVNGLTLCNDNGTTSECAAGDFIMNLVKADPNPQLAALTFAYSSTMLFQQLEDRHLFMEDVSGLNFMMTGDWQLYMVDADSLVFYNDSRIYSKVSCNADDYCPSPSGNLWVEFSLNVRIYGTCRDLKGICEDNECRGFGTELHACGVANWYLCRLSTFFNENTKVGKLFRDVCLCMKNTYPHARCTFRKASDKLREAMDIYIKENKNSLPK